MALILPGNVASAAPTTFSVANSCRFNDGDSSYMEKSSSAGNRKTFTFSAWVKRGILGGGSSGYNTFFSSDQAVANSFRVTFNDDDGSEDDRLMTYFYTGSQQMQLITNRVFRDCSAWYHIVIAVDTTQAVAANRTKLYVNGVQETSLSTANYPDQNQDMSVNQSGAPARVGAGTDLYFDGYMAEVCLIDGSALAPTSFGEFNEDSPTIWQPIDVSGLTFGTNGFYLDFEASDNLGNDANGGTDLTETNLAAADQSSDSPTNNFCTFNPLYRQAVTLTLSEGNCKVVTDSNDTPSALTTMGMTAGKWYCEFKLQAGEGGNVRMDCGVTGSPNEDARNTDYVGQQDYGYGYSGESGNKRHDQGTTGSSYGNAMSVGDIIGVALDLDNLKIYFAINNTWQNSGDPESGATGTGAAFTVKAPGLLPEQAYFFSCSDHSAGYSQTIEANFGGCSAFTLSSAAADGNGYGAFEYAPPSGYLALCTKNLAEEG